MRNTILIAGKGKLANSISQGLPRYLEDYHIDSWENHADYPANTLVIVHIGSGRQLEEVIDFCRIHKVPLIQGSTGMNIDHKDFDFLFIDAPNLSILMLKFMLMLKEFGPLYKNYNISVTESHQHTKKSVPGTAVEMADSLGVAPGEIKSIRDRDDQENIYGISKDFLSLHAYHDICIQEGDTTINFKTLVKGHESYVSGLSGIIACLKSLQDRYYHILELIKLRLI